MPKPGHVLKLCKYEKWNKTSKLRAIMAGNSSSLPVSLQEFDFGVHGFPQTEGAREERPNMQRERTYLKPTPKFSVVGKKVGPWWWRQGESSTC